MLAVLVALAFGAAVLAPRAPRRPLELPFQPALATERWRSQRHS